MDVKNQLTLRRWRADWWRWDGRRYVCASNEELTSDLIRWLERGTVGIRCGIVSNIIQCLIARTIVVDTIEQPKWIDDSMHKGRKNCIAVANGILNLNDQVLTEHDPRWFSTTVLPYDFNPSATCPRWEEFLIEMLPESDMRAMLQEWFGLCSVIDTTFHKFMLLVGDGANGKTIVLTVLRQLLGCDNVSHVGLEGFNSERTFALAATVGKLANIIPELGELTRTNEGVLKSFVAGEPMSIERKHRDPFVTVPSARLIIATNILPRFVDRSDGLWRRLLLVPFRVQILDESRQDKRLVDPQWWQESGELPGILNWAIAGLKRLREQGRFTEPQTSKTEKDQYRRDANPAGTFLEERCLAEAGSELPAPRLYFAYQNYVRDAGQHPLGAPQFAKEVRRAFPSVELTPNPVWIDDVKARAWIGLKLNS